MSPFSHLPCAWPAVNIQQTLEHHRASFHPLTVLGCTGHSISPRCTRILHDLTPHTQAGLCFIITVQSKSVNGPEHKDKYRTSIVSLSLSLFLSLYIYGVCVCVCVCVYIYIYDILSLYIYMVFLLMMDFQSSLSWDKYFQSSVLVCFCGLSIRNNNLPESIINI